MLSPNVHILDLPTLLTRTLTQRSGSSHEKSIGAAHDTLRI